MKLKKLLLAAMAVFLIGKTAYSQVAFVDTFTTGYGGGYSCPVLDDSGFAVFGGYYIHRTDKNGKILWEDSIAGTNEGILNISKSREGNIIILFANDITNVYRIEKLNNKTGAVIWQFSLPQLDDSIVFQLFSPATDGGFFIGGLYEGDKKIRVPRVALAKIDSTGRLMWFQKYNGTNAYWTNYAQADNEDGVFLLSNNNGSLYTPNGSSGPYNPDTASLIKINSSGNLEWQTYASQKTASIVYFFTFYSLFENPADSSITELTNFFVADDTIVYTNLGFLKFDKNGKLVRTFSIPGTTFTFQQGYCTGITNGNYTIVGQEDTELCYLQTDSNGNILWIKNYPSPNFDTILYFEDSTIGNTYVYSIYPIEDTDLVISGNIEDIVGKYQYWNVPVAYYLMKYGQNYATGVPRLNPQSTSLTIYPNPVTDNLLLISGEDMPGTLVKIYNDVGQQMLNTPISLLQNNPQSIDVSNLSAGLYLITLQTGSELVTKKFIKL